MGTFPPEKIAEIPSAQGLGYFSRSKFGLVFDHTKKIQQFDEIKILSLKGLKKRNISLPVNDDPQNPLNSPNNFAAVTSIIVHHGPAVIDYDKMLSFARSCDAEPDKLQELGARLIQQMKEAAATAR